LHKAEVAEGGEAMAPSGYDTLHDIDDPGKLHALTLGMERDGWQGAPLVAVGTQLLTGAHRAVAAEAVGIRPPVVQLEDILPGAHSALREAVNEHGWGDTAVQIMRDAIRADDAMIAVADEYGLEWDV